MHVRVHVRVHVPYRYLRVSRTMVCTRRTYVHVHVHVYVHVHVHVQWKASTNCIL